MSEEPRKQALLRVSYLDLIKNLACATAPDGDRFTGVKMKFTESMDEATTRLQRYRYAGGYGWCAGERMFVRVTIYD